MKITKIQIQLADKGIFLTKREQEPRERAAIEEIYSLIPVLNEVSGSLPSISVGAIDNQVFLSVSILSGTRLFIDAEKWSSKTRRILEIDDGLVDQVQLEECIQLTRLLLAKAAMKEPDSIRIYREQFEARIKGKVANKFRKELGNRFALTVDDTQHSFQKPLLPTEYVEPQLRSLQATVRQMQKNTDFKCNQIIELCRTPLRHNFFPDPRATFPCTRILAARSYGHGQILHRSMESKLPVQFLGHLVIHEFSGEVIALQIVSVSDSLVAED